MTQRSNHHRITRAISGADTPRAAARALEDVQQLRTNALIASVSLTALVLVVVLVLITSPHGAG